MTTDANFGGEGTNSWAPIPTKCWLRIHRTSLEAKDDSLQLRDTKTNSQRTFSKLGDLSSAGSSHQNTSGQFVQTAIGDTMPNTRKSDISLDSTSSWNYPDLLSRKKMIIMSFTGVLLVFHQSLL